MLNLTHRLFMPKKVTVIEYNYFPFTGQEKKIILNFRASQFCLRLSRHKSCMI